MEYVAGLTGNPEFTAAAGDLFAGQFEFEIRTQERHRIARELHDSTAQLLVALQLKMMRIKNGLGATGDRMAFLEVEDTISRLHQEIRAIVRDDVASIAGGSLPVALQTMAQEIRRQAGLAVDVDVCPIPALRGVQLEPALYRIAQEALANVVRHARAKCVRIRIGITGGLLSMTVDDDGIGIVRQQRGSSASGRGIANMRSRARELGGQLSIRRLHPGTRLQIRIPVRSQRRSDVCGRTERGPGMMASAP